MDEDNKLSLKRVELSLTKFNEVAIPHHLDLLRQHKANIIKCQARGELRGARLEQLHAARVAGQLRALLGELAGLRAQVRPADLARFDQLTQTARDTTLRAVVDYLGLIESSCRALGPRLGPAPGPASHGTSPLSMDRPAAEEQLAASVTSTESVGVVRGGAGREEEEEEEPPAATLDQLTHVQLHVDPRELAMSEREAVLAGWSELQDEVRALHEAWRRTHEAALAHRQHVALSGARLEQAAHDVRCARAQLASAERLRAGSYWVGGACVGALVGGPLGLAAGAKAGALCAAAGSLLGYLGARLLRPGQTQLQGDEPAERDRHGLDKDKDQ